MNTPGGGDFTGSTGVDGTGRTGGVGTGVGSLGGVGTVGTVSAAASGGNRVCGNRKWVEALPEAVVASLVQAPPEGRLL